MYRILSLCVGLLLLVGIADLPYGYYTFLRISVFLVAGYGAIRLYDETSSGWAIVLAGVAVLWNPIVPIYLDKSAWVVLDLIGGVIMLVSAFQVTDSSQTVASNQLQN